MELIWKSKLKYCLQKTKSLLKICLQNIETHFWMKKLLSFRWNFIDGMKFKDLLQICCQYMYSALNFWLSGLFKHQEVKHTFNSYFKNETEEKVSRQGIIILLSTDFFFFRGFPAKCASKQGYNDMLNDVKQTVLVKCYY